MFDILKLKKALSKMNSHLSSKTDQELIEGYKNVMKDYRDTNNEKCLAVAEIIKNELVKRGVDIE